MADKMEVDAVNGEEKKEEETVQEVSPQRSTQSQPPQQSREVMVMRMQNQTNQ